MSGLRRLKAGRRQESESSNACSWHVAIATGVEYKACGQRRGTTNNIRQPWVVSFKPVGDGFEDEVLLPSEQVGQSYLMGCDV